MDNLPIRELWLVLILECQVIDVRKRDSILHYITDISGTPSVGDQVECTIDSLWRNQLSAMHTISTPVSALANEEWGHKTVGNQIGFDRTRIDLQFENRCFRRRSHGCYGQRC